MVVEYDYLALKIPLQVVFYLLLHRRGRCHAVRVSNGVHEYAYLGRAPVSCTESDDEVLNARVLGEIQAAHQKGIAVQGRL